MNIGKLIRKVRDIVKKKRPAPTTGRQPGDPTEEEIAAACLKIQETWDEFTFMQRAGKRPWSNQLWKPPTRYYGAVVSERRGDEDDE